MGFGTYYKGKTTGGLYRFLKPLVDDAGHPIVGGQYSSVFYDGAFAPPGGEIVVVANHDGSVMRGTAGQGQQKPSSQQGIGNITLPTRSPSAWEVPD